jgi:hypothetical protein
MERKKQIHSLVLICPVVAIIALGILLPVNFVSSAQETQEKSPVLSAGLPPELSSALALAWGDYKNLVSHDEMLTELLEADIVLIGEAHYDGRDMQTAFEILRRLSQSRRVALAVERFPVTLQPRLEALSRMGSEAIREAEMKSILQAEDYQTVWGMSHDDPAQYANPFDIAYPRDTPSAAAFEEMAIWAARARIPLLALDLPLTDRALGLGEDIPYRNELWKNQIILFLEQNRSEDYLVVVIGGIDHLSNDTDSVQDKLRQYLAPLQILSIGQRDANYPSEASRQVEELAAGYQINDLILRNPQYAVTLQNGATIFPSPPEYWIVVSAVDSWEIQRR